MPKKVRIQFESRQEAEGDSADISQILEGDRYDKDGDVYLRFEENVDGAGVVKSTMRIRMGSEPTTGGIRRGTSVHITRTGAVKTNMDFKPGQDTMCTYSTPLGVLTFVISTDQLEIVVEEDLVKVDISYDMYANGSQVSRNTMTMTAK
jgi:uncharacterized beta-barrel protein YwiB (DUF1934 family)